MPRRLSERQAARADAIDLVLTACERTSESLDQNLRGIAEALHRHADSQGAAQRASVGLVVLPELLDSGGESREYVERITRLARDTGHWIVGGTRYIELEDGSRVNEGIVASSAGTVVTTFRKLHPFWEDGLTPGDSVARFSLDGWMVAVVVCADLWRPDVCTALAGADLVVVPCFSISRRRSPLTARALWHRLASVRAYELGAYVGVSDWTHPSEYRGRHASGASVFARPMGEEPADLMQALSNGVRGFRLDGTALDVIRRDREAQGFGMHGQAR